MRDAFVDVTFEIPLSELAIVRDPTSFVLEQMRISADHLCDESKARLRTDRAPEVHVSQAVEVKTGKPMVLCASRWSVELPESVEVARA